MTDEELLTLYRKYKKKRLLIILFVLLIIMLVLIVYLIVNKDSVVNNKEDHVTVEIEKKDKNAPEIKLNASSIEIIEGGDLDYLKYVESVKDDMDGDLSDDIVYTEIDLSKVGEQKIIYSISDSSGNVSQEVLLVYVIKNELPVEENIQNVLPPKSESNYKEESNSSSVADSNNNISNNDIPSADVPSYSESQSNNSSEKIVKYFLFKDGYTMLNVAEECAKELKKTNKTGMCSPIQDENGIYLGMKLETN